MTGSSFLPIPDQSHDTHQRFEGVAKVKGPRWARMPLLTVGMMGPSVVWSTEFGYASPYLLNLGMKRSVVATVFLAGPISGLLVQPLIGVLADKCTSRMGRRRPYILGGGFIVVLGVLMLGFTKRFSGIVTTDGTSANHTLTLFLAALSVFMIDFAINAVMAADRALLVDVLDVSEQPAGNAWAGIMGGTGSVFGFFLGFIPLATIFPFMGDTQLKVLAVLGTFIFIGTHLAVFTSVKERRLLPQQRVGKRNAFQSTLGIFTDLWKTYRMLPYNIRQIVCPSYPSWIGWFPMLFYTTTYIGEVYTQQFTEPTRAQIADGTRLGNRAMFFQAIFSLIASIGLPFIVLEKGKQKRFGCIDLAMLWALSQLLFATCMISTFFIESVPGLTLLVTLVGASWAVSMWAPFALLGEQIHLSGSGHSREPFDAEIALSDRRTRPSFDNLDQQDENRFLIGGDEDNDENDGEDLKKNDHAARVSEDSEEGDSMEGPDGEVPPEASARRSSVMGNAAARQSMVSIDVRSPVFHNGDLEASAQDENDHDPDDIAAKSGVILGIHNVFIVIPQFINSGISSIVFMLFEPHRSVLDGPHPAPAQGHVPINDTLPLQNVTSTATSTLMLLAREGMEDEEDRSPNALAFMFRFGGFCALIAFALAWRLAKTIKAPRR
ncbi:MFS general substrate transporter [Sistotremastrum niveocremeum HHB9708]|uniref:MFS general substrate transporter n=1 Tax=Sistotremastrum niveocremeum HHB9708 TaxID=1314777 RepID=A0A164YBD8_9AGAM|nr:MFS general substrate transporter [Sistotremastrum niveocremeum HHB9708]